MNIKVVLIVQARMGSTRLPGKSMMDLAGAPLVGRILERVKRAKKIHKIVLATSDQEKDNILESLANDYDVSCFRGSENDLVDRYYQAAKFHGANIVLRLPADCPFPEPSEYDRLIEYHLKNNYDFTSNIYPFMNNGYPSGIGVEAFNYDVLEKVWEFENNPIKREHIALNFFDYINNKIPDQSPFSISTILCPKKMSRPDIDIDINTEEDYLLVKRIYEDVVDYRPFFNFCDVIKWYDLNIL